MVTPAPVIGYSLNGRRYLNVTNRCTLRCSFCPKFNGTWDVKNHDLKLKQDPTATELLEAVGDPSQYDEVVFCGFGEPTLRLYTILEVAKDLTAKGVRTRLNTDGLANFVHQRDITPDLEGNICALSVSLNAHNAAIYNRHCRPVDETCYGEVLDFIARAREYVPFIALTAIDGLSGVDIGACKKIAHELEVEFRSRKLGIVG